VRTTNENNDVTTSPIQSQNWPAPQQGHAMVPAPTGYPVATAYAPAAGPIGKVRGTGACIALTIVTLGIYSLYWYYATHDEMKKHKGDGLGGGLALVLAIFIGIASPFLSSSEVGKLYERRGMRAPVSGVTGLWFLLLSWFFRVGAIVWFVKTNGALNAYWRSQGGH
jgi:hypothetical protein